MFIAVKVQVDQQLGTCCAGGVEILRCHKAAAPRRQDQAAPHLEEYHFMPYKTSFVSEDKEDLLKYKSECMSVISQQIRAIMKSEEKLLNKGLLQTCFCESSECETGSSAIITDKDKVLHSVICDIYLNDKQVDIAKHAKNVLMSRKSEFSQDKLLKLSKTVPVLKPCLDIVIENCQGGTMKILEYSPLEGRLYESVVPQMARQPAVNISYTVTGPDVGSLQQEELDAFDVKTLKWEINGTQAPNQISSMDLVVVQHMSLQAANVEKSLSQLRGLVKDGGFILLCEPTDNLDLLIGLYSQTQDFTTLQDERACGPFCDTNTWRDIISSSGLDLVAERHDGILYNLFLCRKPMTATLKVPHQTVIDVSSTEFTWVNAVRKAMINHAEKDIGRNIWLKVDTVTHSGVVGMVNCLRHETGGDRLRYETLHDKMQISHL